MQCGEFTYATKPVGIASLARARASNDCIGAGATHFHRLNWYQGVYICGEPLLVGGSYCETQQGVTCCCVFSSAMVTVGLRARVAKHECLDSGIEVVPTTLK